MIFLATVAHTMAPGLYKSLPYDFEKDFGAGHAGSPSAQRADRQPVGACENGR